MKRSDLVDVTLKTLGENVYFSSFRAVSNCGNGGARAGQGPCDVCMSA